MAGGHTVRGIGTDVVEVVRIAAAARRTGGRILVRIFTPAERDYCTAQREWAACFAARFAAKEAVLKALGTGLSGCRWHDVEIVRRTRGGPEVKLSGGAARQAAQRGVGTVLLSMAHEREYAVAFAVALGLR